MNISFKCPDCSKDIVVEYSVKGAKKVRKSRAKSTKSKAAPAKKKRVTKKTSPKKGKYDDDLEKLMGLKRNGPVEDIKLQPGEKRDPKQTLKDMEEAAKKNRKESRAGKSLDGQIQAWLTGGPNPFSGQ